MMEKMTMKKRMLAPIIPLSKCINKKTISKRKLGMKPRVRIAEGYL